MYAYKALDVADYIVHRCLKIEKTITHLHLQKILYYIEAHYLLENKSLFDDEISKWKLGPVVESVYHEYKTFGSNGITHIPTRLVPDTNGGFTFKEFQPKIIHSADQEKIEQLILKYIDKDPFILVDATHTHTPWKEDESKILSGIQGLKYDKIQLLEYFTKNPSALEV